jgi:hypothetical protein
MRIQILDTVRVPVPVPVLSPISYDHKNLLGHFLSDCSLKGVQSDPSLVAVGAEEVGILRHSRVVLRHPHCCTENRN